MELDLPNVRHATGDRLETSGNGSFGRSGKDLDDFV
jgi:hypothetical protein